MQNLGTSNNCSYASYRNRLNVCHNYFWQIYSTFCTWCLGLIPIGWLLVSVSVAFLWSEFNNVIGFWGKVQACFRLLLEVFLMLWYMYIKYSFRVIWTWGCWKHTLFRNVRFILCLGIIDTMVALAKMGFGIRKKRPLHLLNKWRHQSCCISFCFALHCSWWEQ